ncbi:uncharacterized protein V1513DRAFT_259443 [Lipomyces chichibuensis]|uniref:uncharacterized protein n=1 Tax=Lipomyces chichibuensis TaxID=1546026 RepID=UPI00334337E0
MSDSGQIAATVSDANKRIVVLIGAPRASALPALPAVRDDVAVFTNVGSGAGHFTDEVDESCPATCDETSHEISRPAARRPPSTRRISYISCIPTSDYLKAFGPQYFSFLAVIMCVSQPILTKSGHFNWITIVDSSVSYRSLIVDTHGAVKPLPISVWDIDSICCWTGSTGKWTPCVGDVVYLSDVLMQEYRGKVSGTTRRHITKMRLLFAPKDLREMSTLDANEEDISLSPFSRTMRELAVELKKWVEVIESNQSMISTPEVSKKIGRLDGGR